MTSLLPKGFKPLALAIVLGGWIFSVCFHEFSHALVAYLGGDKSVKKKGYLTFNPLRYTSITSSLVYPVVFLLLGGIGLPGAAVYINPNALRSRVWDAAVSLAGPLANALLLCAMMIPFWYGKADPKLQQVFWSAYACLCYLQITAVVFNLIPIPPLDGFGAISAFFPRKARGFFYTHSQLLFLLLVVAIWRVKPVGTAYWQVVRTIARRIELPTKLAVKGLEMIRFRLLG